MSTLAGFLEGATGDPSNSKRQIAGHACRNIDDFNALRDSLMNGGRVGFEKTLISPQKIRAGGEPPALLDGKATIPPYALSFGDVDPNDRGFLHLLANLFRQYLHTDNTTWFRWDFAVAGLTAPTAADDFLKLIEDTDAIPRTRFLNNEVTGLTLAAEPGGSLLATFDMQASRFDWWDLPEQITGAASDLPTILGDYSLIAGASDAWDDGFTDSLFIEVISITSGVATLKATFDVKGGGAPAFLGVETFDYTLGNIQGARVVDSDTGLLLGDRSRPILITFLAGATLVATDVFEIPLRRVPIVQTLPAERAIAAVNSQLYHGTEQIAAEGGWSLALSWDSAEVVLDVSQEQGGRPRRRGDLQAVLTVTRELEDLILQRALARKSTEPFVIQCQTNEDITGAAGIPYAVTVVLPALRVGGTSYGIEPGGQNTQEEIELTAAVPGAAFEFPAGSGETYASHCHVVVDNGHDIPI